MEKFIIAAGCALRVSDTQRGDTTIVLLHGYLESLEVWDSFTGQLAQHYRVIAIDIPGMGISQTMGEMHTMDFLAQVIKDVLNKLGIERCFIIGHSMGGYVAEAFASSFPERLQGLVLFHSTPNSDSEEKKEARRREIEMIRAEKKELIASLFAPKGFALSNRHRLRDAIDQLEEQMSLNDDQGIIAILNGLIERQDMNDMMRQLKVPQLFIFGREDEFIPVSVAEELAIAHPQAEIAWLEKSGHMGFIEEPKISEEIITRFIEKNI